MVNKDNILVAVPVFNEHRYIDDILRKVHCFSDNILVIDDGSTDGTSTLLEKCIFINVLSHKANQGYGKSLIDAFRFAFRNGFDWIITLDCDHQHEPSYLPHFYAEIEKDDVDVISGSRYLEMVNSGTIHPPLERIAINKKITQILNRHLGTQLTDSFCGFKAYRTQSVITLKLTEAGYGFPLQFWIRANKAGLKIREIPVPLIYHDPNRTFGGLLEVPQIRFRYYMDIMQYELGTNLSENLEIPEHSR
jgi:glycosyltransferase involved in cell wall biosynthesis